MRHSLNYAELQSPIETVGWLISILDLVDRCPAIFLLHPDGRKEHTLNEAPI